MNEDVKCIFTVYLRCPNCFLCWSEEVSERTEMYREKICDFCEKDPSAEDLLERMLDVMKRTRVDDFPNIVKHLYEVVKLKL